MEEFKPSYSKKSKDVPLNRKIILLETEDFILSIGLGEFSEIQSHRIRKMNNIPNEKTILRKVIEWEFIAVDKGVYMNLKNLCVNSNLIDRYEFLLADILENGKCEIYDKFHQKFVTHINVVTEDDNIGDLMDSGGRTFYVNEKMVHKTMDWIS